MQTRLAHTNSIHSNTPYLFESIAVANDRDKHVPSHDLTTAQINLQRHCVATTRRRFRYWFLHNQHSRHPRTNINQDWRLYALFSPIQRTVHFSPIQRTVHFSPVHRPVQSSGMIVLMERRTSPYRHRLKGAVGMTLPPNQPSRDRCMCLLARLLHHNKARRLDNQPDSSHNSKQQQKLKAFNKNNN